MKRRLDALERSAQLASSTIDLSSGTYSVAEGLEAGLSAGAAAAEAIIRASSAEAKADGAVHTYFGPTKPGGNIAPGDFWRRDDGVVFQFDGGDWVELSGTDPQLAADVEAALDRIAHNEEALDGKVSTYYAPAAAAPTATPALGDLWVVSDKHNLTRRWDGTRWVDLLVGWDALDESATSRILSASQSAATAIANAASAQAAADGAVVTFFGTTTPVDAKDGDLWYVGGLLKQRVGGEWVRTDAAVQTSLDTTNSNVANMQTSVDAANTNVANVQAGLTDAIERLDATEAAVDGKITTYIGPNAQLPQCTNFVTNGNFENGNVGWSTDAAFQYIAEAAYNGKYGCRIKTSTSGNVYPRNSTWTAVAAGEVLTMTAMMRVASGSLSAANAAGMVVRFTNADNTTTSWQVGRTTNAPTATSAGWVKVQATYTVPANAVRAQGGFWLSKTSAVSYVDVDDLCITGAAADTSKLQIGDLWVVTDKSNLVRRWDGKKWVDCTVGSNAIANNAITSTKISNNAVTAPKLESNLVLSSRIVAGDPNGAHAELRQDGFHAYADGSHEVIRLGVEGQSDYMTVMRSDGSSAAGITQTGMVNAQGISAGSKFWYKGREMTDITDDMPMGVIAVGKRTSNSDVITTARQWAPFMRIDAALIPGRIYKLTASPFHVRLSGGVIGRLHIACAYGKPCKHQGVDDSTHIDEYLTSNKVRIDYDLPAPLTVVYQLPDRFTEPTAVSFLLGYGPMQANGSMQITPSVGNDFWPTQFLLEDLGKPRTIGANTVAYASCGNVNMNTQPGFMQAGVINGNPTARAIYNVDSAGKATKTTISGVSADTLYQGPDINTGQRRVSVVAYDGLPSVTTGRDLKGFMLCVNTTSWYYHYGGTIRMTPTTWLTPPSSFNLNDLPPLVTESAGFPNPGYRYIPVPPEWWSGFKTGQFRGFCFVGDATYDTSAVLANAPDAPTVQTPFIQLALIPNQSGIA